MSAGKAFDELAGHLFFWLVLGFVVGVALPIFWLFYYDSAIAPVMIIFTVPLGLSAGALIATVCWRVHAVEA